VPPRTFAPRGIVSSERARQRRRTATVALLSGIAVAAALGVLARVHAPTPRRAPLALGFSQPAQMKIWFTRAAALLALFQLFSGLRLYGRVPFPRRLPRWFPPIHRASGGLAVLLTLPVAFDCVWAFGLKTTSLRVGLHSVVGLVFFGAFTTKVVAVQTRRRPAWLIPVAGGTLFAGLALLWVTTIGWLVSIY
jgi:hypothetical protein